MARGGIGKTFNTAAGLFLIAGAVIAAWWLFGKVRGGALDNLLSGLGGSVQRGGIGAGYPMAGGQFGPTTSPIAANPAVSAAQQPMGASSGGAAAVPSYVSGPITTIRTPSGPAYAIPMQGGAQGVIPTNAVVATGGLPYQNQPISLSDWAVANLRLN